MFDKIFFVILVLNATGLFRFVAPQLGVDIRTVSIGLLVLNAIYLVSKWRYTAQLTSRPMMLGWLFVLLVWPLITFAYAPSYIFREFGLQIYYASLFCCAAVYTMANGLRSFHHVLGVSLLASIFGILLSMMVPSYFRFVAALAQANIEGGRAYGFFMQPNTAAVGIIFLFIGWFALLKRKNGLFEVLAILVFLGVILLTGSRTGIVLAALTVVLIVIPSLKSQWNGGRYIFKVAVLVVCLAVGVIMARNYVGSISWVAKSQRDFMARVTNLLEFKLTGSGGLAKDGSIRHRVAAQEAYMSLIEENPLFGYGLGAQQHFLAIGRIPRSAHSQALSCALMHGVFYPVVFILLIILLWWNRNRAGVEGVLQTKCFLQFALVLLVVFFINGSILQSRVFFVVWGMLFAMVACPRYLFNYGINGKIESYKTRREIIRGSAQSIRPWKTVGASKSTGYDSLGRGVTRG